MTLFADVFKLFWPSYAVFWVISIALATGAWFLLTKIYSNIKFKIWAPPLVATFFTVMLYASNFLSIYQSQILYSNQQAAQKGQQQQAAAPGQQQELDPETQMKADFLAKIEKIVFSGKLDKNEKTKLFKEYAKLFKKPADKKIFHEAINKVYSCQRVLWEDALASFKAKTAIKSDTRVACEKLGGEFFMREKLFTPEAIKNQDELISNIAARKRVPASDGKEQELNEDMIRQGIDAQSNALYILSQLFE
ncbi:MAG: hypothetical protein IPM57_03660 [Oligoflexia bacterium]|nr:hypothetical protein [Oligoflexia bacterium]